NELFLRVSEDKLLHRPGFATLRKELLTSALKYYHVFSSRRSDNPGLRVDLAWSQYRLATITGEIGSREEAAELYQAALVSWRELEAVEPENGSQRRLVAGICLELGDVQYGLGRIDSALEMLCAARDRWCTLAQEANLPEDWCQLAKCHRSLARAYEA